MTTLIATLKAVALFAFTDRPEAFAHDVCSDATRRERRCEMRHRERAVRITRIDAMCESPFRICDRGQATPEQLRDTGELDGVPVRTFAQCEQDRLARLDVIARLIGDGEKRKSMAGIAVELIPIGCKRGMIYPSIKAAARAVGVNDSNVGQQLKRHATWGGYIWRFRGRKSA